MRNKIQKWEKMHNPTVLDLCKNITSFTRGDFIHQGYYVILDEIKLKLVNPTTEVCISNNSALKYLGVTFAKVFKFSKNLFRD